jgi:hypothetical protein
VYLDRARSLATFLLAQCRRADGALLRFPGGSGPEVLGFCEDHVHVIAGLLDLADVTGEASWVEAARDLTDRLDTAFQDERGGGFWTASAALHEALFTRTKETWDSPIPSDNGTAAHVNLRLFARTGEKRYGEAADRTLDAFRPLMAHPRMTSGVMGLLRALSLRMELEAAGAAGAARGDVHARAGVADVDLFLQREAARPGSRVPLVVRVRLDAGWHVNANQPSAPDRVATELAAGERSPAALEAVRYPEALRRVVGPPGSAPLALYEGTFDIHAVLVVPADAVPGPRRIALRLTLQPCDEGRCLAPVTVEVEVGLRFGGEDGPGRHPSLFEAAK